MIKSGFSIKLLLAYILFACTTQLYAQNVNRIELEDYERDSYRKVYLIPDLPGYVTLKGDFHMHTIFSDGLVWPEFRVQEAWREGLDVIAITDHIEYKPHKEYLKGDHNTSFEIAGNLAENLNIMLIQGTEITGQMPPGHLNALFLDDANLLDNEDPMVQIEAANAQGAFLIWNHPGWDRQQPDTTKWWDFHTTILEKGWLHGVEVANGVEWYPVAMDWCRDKKLTAFANTDLHQPSNFKGDLSLSYAHRPMTLVIARDRTLEAVREALFSRRTIGFTGKQLMGEEELILDLFAASVQIHTPFLRAERKGRMMIYRELENQTDLTFILEKEGGANPGKKIELHPRSIVILDYPEEEKELRYRLVNCWTGSRDHPSVIID